MEQKGVLATQGVAAELDRATNIAVDDLEREQQQQLDRDRASSLGGKVLTYNPEQSGMAGNGNFDDRVLTYNPGNAATEAERSVEQSNRFVRDMAAVENYGQQVLENPVLAGAESKIQVKERLAEDYEDVENEKGFSPYAQNIMDSNNKRMTNETVAWVDKMIAENNFHPAQLEEKTNKVRVDFLLKVFNRVFKSRN